MTQSPDPTTRPDSACSLNGGAKGDEVFHGSTSSTSTSSGATWDGYPLNVVDLGLLPYAEALALQREVHERVLVGDQPDTLLLVEHPPVITISRRRTASDHLLASPDRLAELGIDVQQTDRGGDITYHGPGQLVAYPIIHLSHIRCNISQYMCLLEQVMIDTAGAFDVAAERRAGMTGVWVTDQSSGCPAKLAALGVRLRKGVTMHGLALNVATDLSHFETIVPCGLADRDVASLSRWLDDRIEMADVKRELVARFVEHSSLSVNGSVTSRAQLGSDSDKVTRAKS